MSNGRLLISGTRPPQMRCGFLRSGPHPSIQVPLLDPISLLHLFSVQLSTWTCPDCLLSSLPSHPLVLMPLRFKRLQQLLVIRYPSSTLQQLPILGCSFIPSKGHHIPVLLRKLWHQYPSHSRMPPLCCRQVTPQTWPTWLVALCHPCIQELVPVLGFPSPLLPFILLGVRITLAHQKPPLQCRYHQKPPSWQQRTASSPCRHLHRPHHRPLRHSHQHQQSCPVTREYRKLWPRLGKRFRRCCL